MSNSLRAAIRDVVDFPKPGIIFKDITPILADGKLFRESISLLCETAGDMKIDKVVGIDARGFIFAAAVADHPNTVIVDQVRNGVAVRMAVLFLLLGSGTTWGGEADV